MKKRNVRYSNLKRIGRGVMGVVYQARDRHLQRNVAVKLIAPEFAKRKDIAKRFINEARLAARLRHPSICPVFDIGRSDDGLPFLTMPLFQGRTLDHYVDSSQNIPIETAMRLVRTLALAMQVAHDNGIVHRDLKPGNIMIQDGRPIVMDFGIALQTDLDGTRLTAHGQQLGSPAYMSPEQIEGDLSSVGPATDIYALGVILFELLAGRPPFVGSLTSLFKQILIDDAPRPSEFRTGCKELDQICAKAMSKNPADRFKSMREFANALKVLLGQRSVQRQPGSRRFRAPGLLSGRSSIQRFASFAKTVFNAPFRARPASQNIRRPKQSSWKTHGNHDFRGGLAVLVLLTGITGLVLRASVLF